MNGKLRDQINQYYGILCHFLGILVKDRSLT